MGSTPTPPDEIVLKSGTPVTQGAEKLVFVRNANLGNRVVYSVNLTDALRASGVYEPQCKPDPAK